MAKVALKPSLYSFLGPSFSGKLFLNYLIVALRTHSSFLGDHLREEFDQAEY